MSNLEAMYRNGGVFAHVCDVFAAYVMPIPDGPYQGGGASIRQWLMADSEDDCREQPPDKNGCPEPDACGAPDGSAPLDAEALREENGKCLVLAEMLEERNVSLRMQVESLSKRVRDLSIDLADTEAELKRLRKENSELKERLSNAKSALL